MLQQPSPRPRNRDLVAGWSGPQGRREFAFVAAAVLLGFALGTADGCWARGGAPGPRADGEASAPAQRRASGPGASDPADESSSIVPIDVID